MLCPSAIRILLTVWFFYCAPAVPMKCFCNSERCLRGLCTSNTGCYVKVLTTQQDTHTHQRIKYGCLGNNTSQCGSSNKSQFLCCTNRDVCNMPLLLKDIISRTEKNEETPQMVSRCPHPKETSAIQHASVILSSILIAVVLLLSLMVFIEWRRNHKNYNERTIEAFILQPEGSRPSVDSRMSRCAMCDV